MVKKDKKEQVMKIIQEIGSPEGPENVWKAIEMIAPRSKTNTLALGKEKGGVCRSLQEERQEVEEFCVKHLHQKRKIEAEEEGEQDEPTCIFVGEKHSNKNGTTINL